MDGVLGRLGKNTVIMSFGLWLRAALQVALFILLATLLGKKNFGILAAVSAVSTALSSFVGAGYQTVTLKKVAVSESELQKCWSIFLAIFFISFPVVFSIYYCVSILILPQTVPLYAILLLGLSEILFNPVNLFVSSAFRGKEEIGKVAFLYVIPVLVRLICVIVLFYFITFNRNSTESLYIWCWIFFLSQILSCLISLLYLKSDIELFCGINWATGIKDLRLGEAFALSNFSLRMYADIDKTMMARFTTLELTGLYSIVYRIIDLVTLPITALLQSAQARLFRSGELGILQAFKYSMMIGIVPFGYSVLCCCIVYLSSFLVDLISPEYAGLKEMLIVFSLMPVILFFRLFLQTTFLSGGKERDAVNFFVLSAIINVTLNFILIPAYSWHGAIYATYISEIIMIVSMGVMLAIHSKNQQT